MPVKIHETSDKQRCYIHCLVFKFYWTYAQIAKDQPSVWNICQGTEILKNKKIEGVHYSNLKPTCWGSNTKCLKPPEIPILVCQYTLHTIFHEFQVNNYNLLGLAVISSPFSLSRSQLWLTLNPQIIFSRATL